MPAKTKHGIMFNGALFLVVGNLFFLWTNAATGQAHDQKPVELSGFSLSEAYQVKDDAPLDLSSSKLRRLIYRLRKVSDYSLRESSQYASGVDWNQVMQKPVDFRFRVFERKLTIMSVAPVHLEGLDAGDPIQDCFLADCNSEQGQRVQVLTLSSPDGWLPKTELNQPVQAIGFLYAVVSDSKPDRAEPERIPLLIAKRLKWFPDQENESLGISKSHVALAQQGVDLGELQAMRKLNGKPLSDLDAVPFLQLLKAVRTLPMAQIPKSNLTFTELLSNSKADHFGKSISFRARVRQCVPVQMDQWKTREPKPFERYYQLIVFPDLDGKKIVVKKPDGEKLEYDQFPATVCVHELPDQLTPEQMKGQWVQVTGFYYRFWRYQSELTDVAGLKGQVSPIVIANRPELQSTNHADLNTLIWSITAGISILAICTLWYFRNPRRPRTASNSPENSLPDQLDIRGLE